MAEKVLRLHPSRVFFLDAGLHLANPEKPVVILPEHYEAPPKVLTAIKSGTLIDVNQNIAVSKEEVKEETPVEVIEPTEDEAPAAEETEGEVEAKEEKKAPAKKKTTKK